MHAYMAWSQKFRKSEISLDTSPVSYTKHSFNSSAMLPWRSTHFSQVHWELDTTICGLVTTECRYTLLPQALCSIEFLAHVTFTCIGPIFSYPHKKLFISSLTRPGTSSSKVARRPWAPMTFLEFAIKSRCVLDSWKIFCCPWIFFGVLESSWTVVKLCNVELLKLITLFIQESRLNNVTEQNNV